MNVSNSDVHDIIKHMDTGTLPLAFTKYFWDVDPTSIDFHAKRFYVIERLLEFGDQKALHWLHCTYGESAVKEVIKESKILSKKSAYFYCLYYQLPEREILCLREDFRSKHRQIWKL